MRAIKVLISFLLLFTTQSFAATGAATVYKITMTKIELCENATQVPVKVSIRKFFQNSQLTKFEEL